MSKGEKFKLAYALSLFTQLGIFVSVVAVVFILGGRYLDKHFNSSPLFLLTGLITSIFVNIYGIYRLVKPLLEDDKKE